MSDSAKRIVIATRGSALALWQARHVAAALERAHPGLKAELNIISTRGDRVLDVAISKIGDKGIFTAELEAALRDGSADIAVHSMKDLPTELPEGLCVGAVLEREDARDVLLMRRSSDDRGTDSLAALGDGAVLGTSSLRRKAMALSWRPDLDVRELRGNVDTRVGKLAKGQYDGVVLALAGLIRLGFWDAAAGEPARGGTYDGELMGTVLDAADWLPAACQGAVAVETRVADARVENLLGPLNHAATRAACLAERAFLAAVGGGCQVPVGAHATLLAGGKSLELHACILSADGGTELRGETRVPVGADGMPDLRPAEELARTLLDRGGRDVLAACRQGAA
jgi:hydroxymethylbilane synthase